MSTLSVKDSSGSTQTIKLHSTQSDVFGGYSPGDTEYLAIKTSSGTEYAGLVIPKGYMYGTAGRSFIKTPTNTTCVMSQNTVSTLRSTSEQWIVDVTWTQTFNPHCALGTFTSRDGQTRHAHNSNLYVLLDATGDGVSRSYTLQIWIDDVIVAYWDNSISTERAWSANLTGSRKVRVYMRPNAILSSGHYYFCDILKGT